MHGDHTVRFATQKITKEILTKRQKKSNTSDTNPGLSLFIMMFSLHRTTVSGLTRDIPAVRSE